MEDKQRQISKAAERDEFIEVNPVSLSPLDEADIDADGRIIEPLKVLEGAAGREDVELNMVAGENDTVFFGVGVEGTPRRTAGDGDGPWRGGFDEGDDCGEHHEGDENNGAGRGGAAEAECFGEGGQDWRENGFAEHNELQVDEG